MRDPIFGRFIKLGKGFAILVFHEKTIVTEPFPPFFFFEDGSLADAED